MNTTKLHKGQKVTAKITFNGRSVDAPCRITSSFAIGTGLWYVKRWNASQGHYSTKRYAVHKNDIIPRSEEPITRDK